MTDQQKPPSPPQDPNTAKNDVPPSVADAAVAGSSLPNPVPTADKPEAAPVTDGAKEAPKPETTPSATAAQPPAAAPADPAPDKDSTKAAADGAADQASPAEPAGDTKPAAEPVAIPPSERQTEKLTRPAELVKPWTPQSQDDPTVPGRASSAAQTAPLNPDLIDTLKDNPDEPRPAPPPQPDPALLASVAAAVTAAAKASGVDLNNANNDDTVRPAPKTSGPTERLPDLEKIVPGASSGIICPNCKHQNRPGELICDNCGTSLISGGKAALGTRDLVKDQEASPGEKLLDTGTQKALEAAGGSSFTESMVLRVEIESGSNPMLIYPKEEIVLGRRDPNTGAIPDVDLTAYAGYRLGVSRRHAIIRMQDKALYLTDLGSSNGSFLNGTRLSPHRPHQLRDGDEVRLGQMALRLYFQSGRR